MYDVITIGSATLDIFVKSKQFKVVKNNQFESGVALCEAFGSKIEADDVIMASGGGATNTSVSFSRKGLKSACIVEMGRDLAAQTVLHDLKQEDVDVSFVVQESGEDTGVSVIMVADEGGRSIVTCRGAAAMLDESDIPWESLNAKWLYITSLGGKLDLLNELVNFAVKNKIKVALNPGRSELVKIDRLREIVSKVEVLNMNLEEASLYLGLAKSDKDEVLQGMKKEGGRLNIVTNGKQGAYVLSEGRFWFCASSVFQAVETTGAGDAFGSGFVTGQILGWDVEKSCQLAVGNAGSVVKYFGAKKGLISLEEFEKMSKVSVEKMSL